VKVLGSKATDQAEPQGDSERAAQKLKSEAKA